MVLFLTGGVALGVGLALGMMMRSGEAYDEGDEALGEYQEAERALRRRDSA